MAAPSIKIGFQPFSVPKDLEKNLHGADKFAKTALKGFLKELKVAGVKAAQRASLPKDTGALYRSFKTDSTSDEKNLFVGSNLEYARVVDGSRKFGSPITKWPSVTALRPWVSRKFSNVSSNELSSLTYLISRKLFTKRHIQKPRRFMSATETAIYVQMNKSKSALLDKLAKGVSK
jgi:hypothetical protein